MKQGIIIGGNGYIGSKLQQKLNYDIYDYGWYDSYRSVDISPSKYRNIILLGGHSSIWMCENDPRGSWINNVDNLIKIISFLKEDQKLIYASSASVYGATSTVASEDHSFTNPKSYYDLQKITLDLIALKEISMGKNIVGLRFGTVNGLSPHTRTDLMINSMTLDAITSGTINLANPAKKRALLFINDLCKAIELATIKDAPGIYNLSSINTSVEEVALAVQQATNAKINNVEMHNPFSFELDSSKFINTFGDYRIDSMTSIINELFNGLMNVRRTRRDKF